MSQPGGRGGAGRGAGQVHVLQIPQRLHGVHGAHGMMHGMMHGVGGSEGEQVHVYVDAGVHIGV